MEQSNQLIPKKEEIDIYTEIAKHAKDSKFFDKVGGIGGILTLMLYARELGISPMSALFGGLNNIMGKIEISPRMMNTMIRKAGHKLEILQNDDTICKIKGIRHDTGEDYIATFNMDDARRAGLIRSGSGWEKYPSDMLFARCISRLARKLFADVIATSYVEGEIERPEELAETPQKSIIEGKAESVEPSEEIIDSTPSEMTVCDFLLELREIVGDKYALIDLEAFLRHLEEEKKVPMTKIMQQALHPALTQRFCRNWQTWYDARVGKEKERAEQATV